MDLLHDTEPESLLCPVSAVARVISNTHTTYNVYHQNVSNLLHYNEIIMKPQNIATCENSPLKNTKMQNYQVMQNAEL